MHELLAPQSAPERPVFSASATQRRVIARYSAPPWPSFNEAARSEAVSINTARGWKKGTHGDGFRSLLASSRAEAIAEYITDLDARMTGLGPAALAAVEKALADDDPRIQSSMARWVVEQIRGKAKERHELAGADGGPVVFTILVDNPNAERR